MHLKERRAGSAVTVRASGCVCLARGAAEAGPYKT
jgi:hypothetical protein